MNLKLSFLAGATIALMSLVSTPATAGYSSGCTGTTSTTCVEDHSLSSNGSAVGASTTVSTNSGANSFGYSSWRLNLKDTPTTGAASTFWAYCIDPLTTSQLTTSYAAVSLGTYLNGTTSSYYAQQIGRSGYSGAGLSNSSTAQGIVLGNIQELFSHAYNDSLANATNAAAFGIALWEIIMQDGGSTNPGNTFSVSTGRVRDTTGDAAALRAQQYLTALADAPTEATAWTNIGLGASAAWNYTVFYDCTSPFSQTFITVTSGTNSTVPVPGTLALVGLGLLGAARTRRARKAA